MALAVILAIVVSASALVLVLLLGVFRRLKALAAATARFATEIRPSADAIRADVARAQERLQAMPDRLPGTGAGARIRR